MNKLQVSVAYALLMLFDTNFAQTGLICPKCPTGYYITRNCSGNHMHVHGIRCAPCTDCSAMFWETLVPCSAYSNSVCGNKTTPMPSQAEPDSTAVPPNVWILTGVFVFMVLVTLLALLFKQKFFRAMVNFKALRSAETGSSEIKALGLVEPILQACPA